MPRLLTRLRQERRPLRFLLSRFLWHTGLGRKLRIRIPFEDRSWIWFHPAAMAATMWTNPRFSDRDVQVLRRLLGPGDVFVDVGANVGVLTLAASNLVGQSGKVVAIEPHPKTFRFLEENTSANGVRNVELHRVAAAESAGHVGFSNLRSDDQNAVRTDGELIVDCVPLDDLLDGATRVSLLKIDTEGFELNVLRGARATISRTRCIYFECDETMLAQAGHRPSEVFELLTSAGFVVYRLAGGCFFPVAVADLATRGENLIAIRSDRLPEILGSCGENASGASSSRPAG